MMRINLPARIDRATSMPRVFKALAISLVLGSVIPGMLHGTELIRGAQSPQRLTLRGRSVSYWLWLPATSPPEGAPLLLFLHGAGERGRNLNLVKKHGPPRLVESMPALQPFILVSPQCPNDQWWDIDVVKALVDHVVRRHRADRARLHITGMSMGGYATWQMVAKHPDLFAAAIPICSGGIPADASKIRHIPIRVYHGALDEVVPVAESERMVSALKTAGARDVTFKIFPNRAHDSWSPVYRDPRTYQWLLQHRRAP
jgi:predicted peptidase